MHQHQEQDIIIMKNTLTYLQRTLVWSPKFDPKALKTFYFKLHFVILCTIPAWLGATINFGLGIVDNHGKNADRSISVITTMVGAYFSILVYAKNIQNLRAVYQKLSDLETFGKPENFDVTNKQLNFYSSLFANYLLYVGGLFFFAPLLDISTCNDDNANFNRNEPCGLIAGLWTPFDIRYFPRIQIVYVIQMSSCLYLYVTFSFISFAIFETVQHINVRIGHVGDLFVEVLSKKNRNTNRDKFYHCIRYHQMIISLADKLNKSIKSCMFLHVLLTAVILGLVAYRLLENASITAMIMFIGWFMTLFVVSYVSQRMIDESMNIGLRIYYTNWDQIDVDTQKDLVLILLRCSKPIYLQTGPFGHLSYITIITVGTLS